MKKSLIKLISMVISIILMMSVFVGCVVQGPSTTKEDKTTAAPGTPVKEAPKMETVTVWTNQAGSKLVEEKWTKEYNETIGKEKGIIVEHTIYGADWANILKIALSAGEGPHLFKGPSQAYIDAGFEMYLEDLVPEAKEWAETTFPGMLRDNMHKFNGKIAAVPYVVSTEAVAVNMDLLKKNGFTAPPVTWDEFADMVRTITKNGKGEEYGFIEGLKSSGYAGWNGLLHYVSAVGHNGFNHNTGKFEYASFAPFYEMLADLKKTGNWFPGAEGLNNDQARAQFAEGNVGFKLSASWDVGVWKDQFPTKCDWVWCRPAANAGGDPYKYYGNAGGNMAVGIKSKEMPEKAFEVYKMQHAEQYMIYLYQGGNQIPVKQEYIEKAGKVDIKNWAWIADTKDVFLYGASGPQALITLEGDTSTAAIAKILTIDAPVLETLQDLDKRYNAAVDKARAAGKDIDQFIQTLDNKMK